MFKKKCLPALHIPISSHIPTLHAAIYLELLNPFIETYAVILNLTYLSLLPSVWCLVYWDNRAKWAVKGMENTGPAVGEYVLVLGPQQLTTSQLLLGSWVLVTEVTGST